MAQRPHIADDGRRTAAAGGGFARCDADQIGAELGEFGQHEAVQPFADGGQQNHGGDAHGDAQGGEKAAHPVGDDGADGQFDAVLSSMALGLQFVRRVASGR